MKTEYPLLIMTIIAAGVFSEKTLVGFDGNVCAAGANALGVAIASVETADIGKPTGVGTIGIFVVKTAADITVGDELECGADGKVTPKTTGKLVGIALDTVLTGDEVRVKLA